MDFRFAAAACPAAALGFVAGAAIFAPAPGRAIDPALSQAARDRAAIAAAVAPLPPAAELPSLPTLPPTPALPDVNAVLKVPRVRAVVVRQAAPPLRAAASGTSRHEQEQEHEGSDHERGDD